MLTRKIITDPSPALAIVSFANTKNTPNPILFPRNFFIYNCLEANRQAWGLPISSIRTSPPRHKTYWTYVHSVKKTVQARTPGYEGAMVGFLEGQFQTNGWERLSLLVHNSSLKRYPMGESRPQKLPIIQKATPDYSNQTKKWWQQPQNIGHSETAPNGTNIRRLSKYQRWFH